MLMFFNKNYVIKNLYKSKSLMKFDKKKNFMGFNFKIPYN